MKIDNFFVVIFFFCGYFPCDGKTYLKQKGKVKEKYSEYILGNWISLEDKRCSLFITKDKWRIQYDCRKEKDISTYIFYNNSLDTVAVIFTGDTLLYHIEALDKDYLDLTYLGLCCMSTNRYNKTMSYRRTK